MKTYEILLAQSDGDSLRPAIRWTLENKGYQVTEALGSFPAMEMLFKKHFDLVITDLVAVLEKAKEMDPGVIAILILTTETRSILSVHAIRSAVDDYLFMPFELTELEVRVADGIERLQLKDRNPQPQLSEKMGDMVKTLSYDIRGSLMSMTATLRLLSHGYYGEMDEGIRNRLKELLSKTVCLIGITEECLSETLSAARDLKMEDETTHLLEEMIYPIGKGFPSEVRKCLTRRPDGTSNNPIPDHGRMI